MAVSAADVRLIMKATTTTLPDATIAPFLAAAGTLLGKIFTDTSVIGVSLLEELEKWLTAHLIASTILRMTSEEKLGDASVKYIGKWESGLSSTPYGQMLLLMDFTGIIAELGKKQAYIYAVKSSDE